MKNKILIFGFILTIGIFFLNSCVKDKWEVPDPIDENVNFADSGNYRIITIFELKGLWDGDTTVFADTLLLDGMPVIGDSLVIEATVISSDSDGNIYKELYVQDSTAGIVLQIDLTGLSIDYPVGQKLAIKCGGLYIDNDNGVIKLGSLFEEDGLWSFGRIQSQPIVDAHIFKMTGGLPIVPKVCTINTLSSMDLATLIKIEDVQFYAGSLGETYADPDLNISGKGHVIEDTLGNQILLYSSSYANFAADSIPSGRGTIVGLYGIYGSTKQLYINSISDVDFNEPRIVYFKKDFEDGNIYSGGWSSIAVIGTLKWTLGTIGGKYAQMSNYSGGANYASEAWFISPAIDVNSLSQKTLTFRNAYKYSGAALKLLISTDYDGVSAPSSATWTEKTFTLSSGNFVWANSGTINLSAYTGNIYIAFKYTGTTSSGSTWEVDDIIIK